MFHEFWKKNKTEYLRKTTSSKSQVKNQRLDESLVGHTFYYEMRDNSDTVTKTLTATTGETKTAIECKKKAVKDKT